MTARDLPPGYGVAAIDDPTPCEASPLADTWPTEAAAPAPLEMSASHTLADGRHASVSALWLFDEWSAWLLVVDGVSRIRASLAPEDEAAIVAKLERARDQKLEAVPA